MSEADVQRDLGRMGAEIAALTRNVEILSRKVEALTLAVSSARGGLKTVLLIAGAAAAVGGLVAKMLPVLAIK